MINASYAESLPPPDFSVPPANFDTEWSHCISLKCSSQVYKDFPTLPSLYTSSHLQPKNPFNLKKHNDYADSESSGTTAPGQYLRS